MILGIYETKYASFTTVDHDNLTNSWHINPKLHSRGGEEKLVAVESSLHDSLAGFANTGVVHAKRGGVVAAVAQLRDQPAIYLAHLVRCLEEDHRLVEGGRRWWFGLVCRLTSCSILGQKRTRTST